MLERTSVRQTTAESSTVAALDILFKVGHLQFTLLQVSEGHSWSIVQHVWLRGLLNGFNLTTSLMQRGRTGSGWSGRVTGVIDRTFSGFGYSISC
jgi:hypothetical protein